MSERGLNAPPRSIFRASRGDALGDFVDLRLGFDGARAASGDHFGAADRDAFADGRRSILPGACGAKRA